jgi:hypothetical protein
MKWSEMKEKRMTISWSEWFWSYAFVALVTAVGLRDVSEFIVGSSGTGATAIRSSFTGEVDSRRA